MALTRPSGQGDRRPEQSRQAAPPTIAAFQTVCDSSLRRVQTVYDLAEKSRVSLRFNWKNL